MVGDIHTQKYGNMMQYWVVLDAINRGRWQIAVIDTCELQDCRVLSSSINSFGWSRGEMTRILRNNSAGWFQSTGVWRFNWDQVPFLGCKITKMVQMVKTPILVYLLDLIPPKVLFLFHWFLSQFWWNRPGATRHLGQRVAEFVPDWLLPSPKSPWIGCINHSQMGGWWHCFAHFMISKNLILVNVAFVKKENGSKRWWRISQFHSLGGIWALRRSKQKIVPT